MNDTPRELCPRCRRPSLLCYCALLPALETRTRIVILQHPRESRVPIGTARMAHLSLPNSELHSGIEFASHPRISALRAQPGTALLFPGEGALDPSQLAPDFLKHLIVIDGTWPQARKVIKLNPELMALPRVGLKPERPGNYRIRLEPSAECLATIEAISSVLGVLENDRPKFDAMLRAFTFMVDQQLLHMAANQAHRIKRLRNHTPTDEARLLAHPDDAVFLHAEVNAHARTAALPGAPELLHLVAARENGDRFEARLAPRRPLGPGAPRHLGLSEEAIRAGDSIESARARFAAWSRPDDLHCTWGHFSSDQLIAERLESRPAIDLRLVVARRLQARPGAPAEALQRLGASPIKNPPDDRASQVVQALLLVIKALRERPKQHACNPPPAANVS